jgi:hypothetical protein
MVTGLRELEETVSTLSILGEEVATIWAKY